MAYNEVLLLKPVDGLGAEGDQVRVRAGYARNFLLPREIAAPVTTANRKQVEALKKRRAEREAKDLEVSQDLAKKLEKTSIAFAVKTGEGGKMFGAITSNDLYDRLVQAGIEIDKKKIHLFTPVKTLGKHEVKIRLHADVTVDISFDVVSENPIVAAPSEEAPVEKKFERRPDRAERGERKSDRTDRK